MYKKLLLLICGASLVGSLESQAQQRWEIGLSGGYTHNTLSADVGYRSFTKYQPSAGFQVSVPVQYHVNDWFGVQLDLSYIQKNYALKRTGFFEGVNSEITNNFIQAPLMAHFSFGTEEIRGFLNLGGYVGYWTSSRFQSTVPNPFSPDKELDDNDQIYNYNDLVDYYSHSGKVEFDSRRDRRVELGLVSGVGAEYRIDERFKVFAEARYYYSATDLQKDYMINQTPRYNNTIGLQAGVFYAIWSK